MKSVKDGAWERGLITTPGIMACLILQLSRDQLAKHHEDDRTLADDWGLEIFRKSNVMLETNYLKKRKSKYHSTVLYKLCSDKVG